MRPVSGEAAKMQRLEVRLNDSFAFCESATYDSCRAGPFVINAKRIKKNAIGTRRRSGTSSRIRSHSSEC